MKAAAQMDLVCQTFGLSKNELARSLGVAPVTVLRWEKDQNDPVGLSREVLTALHLVAMKLAGDKQRALEIGRRLSRGLGALLADELLQGRR